MPQPNNMPLSDEMKMQLVNEAEERAKAARGIQPGRKRPTKYVTNAPTEAQLKSLTPFYSYIGKKPPAFSGKRLKWYFQRHKERKKLRKQLKEDYSITKRIEFETVAREVGLGIDNWFFSALGWIGSWLMGAGGIASILGTATVILGAAYAFSYISEQVGSFTIQLNPTTMQDGFVLSDTISFETVTGRLESSELFRVNAISIDDLNRDANSKEGNHNGDHFVGYSFYIKNTSEEVRSYEYVLRMTDSMFNVDQAVWAIVYEDGKQMLYAAPSDDGDPQVLWGYPRAPFFSDAYNPEEQYFFYLRDYSLDDDVVPDQILRDSEGNKVKFISDLEGNLTVLNECMTDAEKQVAIKKAKGTNSTILWGLNPTSYIDTNQVMRGIVQDIQPGEVHKYTVLLWLEGDDPDCEDKLFGGYAKYMMEFNPITEENMDLFGNVYRKVYNEESEKKPATEEPTQETPAQETPAQDNPEIKEEPKEEPKKKEDEYSPYAS